MENLLLVILLVILLYVLFNTFTERFSQSGLGLSDRDCSRLVDVYFRPNDNQPQCRNNYNERICGLNRRNTVDPFTGNYFTINGMLV